MQPPSGDDRGYVAPPSSTDEQLADFDIAVNSVPSTFTVSNRALLIRRKVDSLIDQAVESSLHMIINGFEDMIPSGMTNGFTAHDFRYILFGGSSFDVHDLMANTRFIDFHRHSPQIL